MNENSLNSFEAYMAEKESKAAKAKKVAAPYVFKLMGELGVSHLVVTYSGEGDSGCFDAIHPAYYTEEEEETANIDACEANNWYAKSNKEKKAVAKFQEKIQKERDWSDWPEILDRHEWEKTIRDVIGGLALWWAPDGFEINDGGHGMVYFNSKKKTVEAEDYARVIDYHHNSEFEQYE